MLLLNIVNTLIVSLAYYNQKTRESLISLLCMYVFVTKEQKEVKANLFTELLEQNLVWCPFLNCDCFSVQKLCCYVKRFRLLCPGSQKSC